MPTPGTQAWADTGLTAAQIRALCVEADVGPRVLVREARSLLGRADPGRSMAAHRARAVLAAAGWPDGPLRARAS
jgi:hypothetical protein